MPRKKLIILALTIFSLFNPLQNANASLISLLSDIQTPQSVNFNQFSGDFNFTSGPIQIGGLISENIFWSSTSSSSVIGSGFYGLGPNGLWTPDRGGYTGLNTPNGTMRFDFTGGTVSSVGGFLNYAPGFGGDPTITALDSNDNTLESYILNISSPGEFDGGAFRGIKRDAPDILAFTVSNSYIVLDDLAFNRVQSSSNDGNNNNPNPDNPSVPEPATFMLMGSGIIGALIRKKRLA